MQAKSNENNSPPPRVTEQSTKVDLQSRKRNPNSTGQNQKPTQQSSKQARHTPKSVEQSPKSTELPPAEAIALLTRKIKADGKNAEWYHQRAETYALIGRNREALADHNKSVVLAPRSIRFLIARGDFFETIAQYDLAYADYLAALKSKPVTAEDFYWHAEILKNLAQYNQAIKYCDTALEKGFKTHRVYRLKGRCFYRMDKPREAIINFRKSLHMVKVPATYIAISRCLRRSANYDESLKALEEAKKIEPLYREIYYELALVHLLLDHREAARKNYDIWIASLPKAPELSTWDSFVRFAELERKLEEYGRMLSLSQTSNEDIFYDRALLYMEEGEYESAAKEMERYLEVTGWRGKSGVIGACYAYIAYRMCGRNAKARSVQLDAKNILRRRDWPYPIFRYLCEELSANKLDALANDKRKKTQAYLFEALDDRQLNQINEANRKLQWIVTKGDKSLDEFSLAQAELRRLAYQQRAKVHVKGGN